MAVARVTGANLGIGRKVARQPAERDRHRPLDEATARAAADEVEGHVRALRLDLSDPASSEGAAFRLTESPGGLDVLVNHAGINPDFARAAANPEFAVARRALGAQVFGASRLDGPTGGFFGDGRAIAL